MFVAEFINGFFDLLTAPFGDRGWPVLVLISALAGIALLLLFKVATPQARLSRARSRLTGHLYELGLFQDDLGVLFRVQRDLAVANLRYVSLTLPALVVLIPPAMLCLVQLESRLQYNPLQPGDTFLVAVAVDADHRADLAALNLEPGDGLVLDSPPVRDGRAGRVWWRLKVETEGWHEIEVVEGGGARWSKQIKAAAGNRRHGLIRQRGGLWTALAHPAEPPLPGHAVVKAIEIHHGQPEADWYAQGWFWWFCAISVIAGLAVKSVFRVEV